MKSGFNLERQKQEESLKDWKFGALSMQSIIGHIPPEEREQFLPQGEKQFGVEDFMDCVTRAYINKLEHGFNWLLRKGKLPHEIFFRENGYITENGFEFSDLLS